MIKCSEKVLPWQIAASGTRLFLEHDQMHIWSFSVQSIVSRLPSFDSLVLSPSERQAASRLLRHDHQICYQVAHAALRDILSCYVEMGPNDLIFNTNDKGKPYLPGADIRFNLSHSNDQVLIGVTRSVEIGVDVESSDRELDVLGLAQRFLSEEEYGYLKDRHQQDRRALFFKLWVLKEAFVKALGLGLSMSLTSFAFGDIEAGDPRLLYCPSEHGYPSDWTFSYLNVSPGYCAAWACGQKIEKIRYFRWNGPSNG